jgi:predicted type IV restriction endonuclease
MSEVLLQTIIEKLEAMELLLKQYKSNKDEEVLKTMLQEIKKISTSSINIDKIDELKLSIDKCCKITY